MARYFNGNLANYLDCGDVASAQITGTDITACIWAKLLTTSGTQNLFCKWGVGANNHEWLIATASGFWEVWTQAGSGAATYSNATGSAIRQNVWQHICLRQNSAGLSIFVDGKLIATNTTPRTLIDTTNRTLIGRHETAGPTNGYLAHAAVWGAALTNDEILQLAQGASPQVFRPGALRGYWKLDETRDEKDWSYRSQIATMAGTVGHYPDDQPRLIRASDLLTTQVGVPPPNVDLATVYVNIQVSSAEISSAVDAAEIYYNIQSTTTDNAIYIDADTVRVTISIDSHDCLTIWDSSQLFALPFERWETQANFRWGRSGAVDRFIVIAGDGLEEC